MTIGPSSSPRGSATRAATYVDSAGRQLTLGERLGAGGEGAVHAVVGHPALAAKIYHQPPDAEQLDKLQAMVARRSDALDVVSAWPHSLLLDARRRACGILIPRIADALQLHELYGTTNRRQNFPEAKWHHLVLAARNVAAAFECMHQAGIVVGDVNQGNLLVDREMCVRFIDCDSFQIESDGKMFPCPVGTPHFTPPELQAKSLREEARTPQQDRFGMAVLMFHLLFVGRHPFAGRFYGAGELTIEKAIAERRFAFSKDRTETLVEPPPASMLLSDVTPGAAALFEAAFRGEPEARPSARAWAEELENLIRQRKPCTLDQAHIYYGALKECPWCRIEDEGGPSFFVLGGSVTSVAPDRLERLEDKLRRLKLPVFPDLAPTQLKLPGLLGPKRPPQAPRVTMADAASWTMALGAAACLAGAVSGWSYLAGAGLVAASAAYLLAGKQPRSLRTRLDELVARFEKQQVQLYRRAQAIAAQHEQRRASFENSVDQLKQEYDNYRNAGTQLHDVLAIYRTMQKNRFLATHLIAKNVRRIPGMSPSLAVRMASYGIESALDVDPIRLLGLPMINEERLLELQTWRDEIERQFVYTPEHGVKLDGRTMANEATVKRFKSSLARRILMAVRQLESVVRGGGEQLTADLRDFDAAAEQVRETAGQVRDFQSNRRPLERAINRSVAVILSVAASAAALGALSYWVGH
jgi:DNA-binding helix-hairpin-helix protein with protein kinase domain